MAAGWLIATFLLVSTTPWSCAAPSAQPPPPGHQTPEPVPTEAPPVEPVDPPELEPVPDPDEVPTPDPSAPCCFTNPSWTGVCEVVPSGDETCASILEYLNHSRSTGKLYCSATDLRGGWEPVPCAAQ